jgi:hypothetical protein
MTDEPKPIKMPSGYLDNCISPTGVVRQQLPDLELAALEELNRREASGQVELYTSDVIKQEISKTSDANTLERLESLYDLYARLPLIDEQFQMPRRLQSSRSGLQAGPIVKDELLGRLSFLPHEMDRRHIYQAAKNDVGYFVTRDCDSVLKYARQIRAEANVIACLPSQFVAVLDAAAS